MEILQDFNATRLRNLLSSIHCFQHGLTLGPSKYSFYSTIVSSNSIAIFKSRALIKLFIILQFDLNELAVVIAASFCLAIFFKYPFGNIKKIFFDNNKIDDMYGKPDNPIKLDIDKKKNRWRSKFQGVKIVK